MGFEFTKEDKDNLNYLLFKFSPKLSFTFLGSMLLSRVTKYKVSPLFQMFILLAIEEYINSFVPRWKDEPNFMAGKTFNNAKSFFTPITPAHLKFPAKKLVFATPMNIQKAKKLQPAISSAQSLNPAHHEL